MLPVKCIISGTLFNRPYLQFAAQCIYRCNIGYSHCDYGEISMKFIYTMDYYSSCDCGFRIKHVPYFYLKTSANKQVEYSTRACFAMYKYVLNYCYTSNITHFKQLSLDRQTFVQQPSGTSKHLNSTRKNLENTNQFKLTINSSNIVSI